MSGKNKKKMGYKQYEKLLVMAHKKSDILAQRLQALQSYLTSYVEYRGDNAKFNDWITEQVVKEQERVQQEKDQVHEKV